MLEIGRGLLGAEQQAAAKKLGGGQAPAGEGEQVELAGALAEHGLEAGEEGGLAAAGRAIEPDGDLVARVEGEGQASELLEEGGGGGDGAGQEGIPNRGRGAGVVGGRHGAGLIDGGRVRRDLACFQMEQAVAAGEKRGVEVPGAGGLGQAERELVEQAGELARGELDVKIGVDEAQLGAEDREWQGAPGAVAEAPEGAESEDRVAVLLAETLVGALVE